MGMLSVLDDRALSSLNMFTFMVSDSYIVIALPFAYLFVLGNVIKTTPQSKVTNS
jgi:hypothetical protein